MKPFDWVLLVIALINYFDIVFNLYLFRKSNLTSIEYFSKGIHWKALIKFVLFTLGPIALIGIRMWE